jgi:hypothetical protein
VTGTAFSRERKLTLVNTIGNVLDLVASGNESGYDISAQRFFAGMKRAAPKRSALCDARKQVPSTAFEYLLNQASVENKGFVEKWHGHPLKIFDGSKINLPRIEELVEKFGVPNTKAGPAHYPQAWMVTMLSGFCTQPLAVTLGSYKASERDLMRELLPKLNTGDLVLVDRGLGGGSVYYDFERNEVFYIHRAKTSGDQVPLYIQEFLRKKRASEIVAIEVTNEHGAQKVILSDWFAGLRIQRENESSLSPTSLTRMNTPSRPSAPFTKSVGRSKPCTAE